MLEDMHREEIHSTVYSSAHKCLRLLNIMYYLNNKELILELDKLILRYAPSF